VTGRGDLIDASPTEHAMSPRPPYWLMLLIRITIEPDESNELREKSQVIVARPTTIRRAPLG
jgi:hypothetical protein